MPVNGVGFAGELFGDPMGGGGPLHVNRARAIRGQVVRVVFSEMPVHKSAVGRGDALNPANYVFSIVSGAATAPQCVGVDPTVAVGPVIAVQAGAERGIDVHTDRALVAGIAYRVTVHDVLAQAGGTLGAPYSATFAGIVRVQVVKPPVRKVDLIDFATSPFNGAFVIDQNGDIAPHGGIEALRKRILRRVSTRKNAFSWLPGYGVGFLLKTPISVSQVQSLKTDILAQVAQEPGVASVQAQLTLNPAGVVTVALQVDRTSGGSFTMGFQRSAAGQLVIV